jgi:hypothetical protein
MQFQAKPPLGILFDTDFGETIDSFIALSILYALDNKNECRIISLSTSKPSLHSAAAMESFTKAYAARPMPIGMLEKGPNAADTPLISAVVANKAYETTISKLNDTAISAALIRNALTSQYDQNCKMVLAGPATNLLDTLALLDNKTWAKSKAQSLVTTSNDPKLASEWPAPIERVGSPLPYPAANLEKALEWSPNHPLRDAAAAWKGDLPTERAQAVLKAVRPNLALDAYVAAITELLSTKPVPRQRPRRPPV